MTIQNSEKVGRYSMDDNTFFSLQKEMAMIRTRQQELITEDKEENGKELARLQVVYDYLRDKYLITIEGNGRLH